MVGWICWYPQCGKKTGLTTITDWNVRPVQALFKHRFDCEKPVHKGVRVCRRHYCHDVVGALKLGEKVARVSDGTFITGEVTDLRGMTLTFRRAREKLSLWRRRRRRRSAMKRKPKRRLAGSGGGDGDDTGVDLMSADDDST